MALSVSSILHYWSARYGPTPVYGGRPVHTRSSAARVADQRGVLHAPPINTPRAPAWDAIAGERRPTMLLEGARTNRVALSEDYSGWSGGAIVTSGKSDPAGGTAASLFDDNGGADKFVAVTPVGDGTKSLSVYIKHQSGTGSYIGLYDATAAAWRHRVDITWSAAGVPSAATGSGSGTIYGIESLLGGWYRLRFTAAGVVAANSNRIYVAPSTAGTGKIFLYGLQLEDASWPSSYIRTTGAAAARAADSFYWDYPRRPQAMMVYARFVEAGAIFDSGVRIMEIANAAGADPRFFIRPIGGVYQVDHITTLGSVSSSASQAFTIGDVVELVALLASDGKVKLIESINGAAVASGSLSGALALAAEWSGERLYLGTGTMGNYAEVKVVKYADVVGATDQAIMDELRAFEVNAAGEVLA